MSSEYVAAQLRHHAWAVERLLDRAALVTPSQLAAEGLSHGTLFATLRHVADVDQSWGRRAQGREELGLEQFEAQLTDLASLRAFWLEEVGTLVAFASAADTDLEGEVRVPWRPEAFRVWQVLTHIANHRAEHGNELGWRLTALGHSPGELGFLAFVLDEERTR